MTDYYNSTGSWTIATTSFGTFNNDYEKQMAAIQKKREETFVCLNKLVKKVIDNIVKDWGELKNDPIVEFFTNKDQWNMFKTKSGKVGLIVNTSDENSTLWQNIPYPIAFKLSNEWIGILCQFNALNDHDIYNLERYNSNI